MITSPEIIIALADSYTEEQLQQQIATLSQQLAEGSGWITSASSGGGTSYSRQQDMPLTDRLIMLRRALAYKTGDSSALSIGSNTPVVIQSTSTF